MHEAKLLAPAAEGHPGRGKEEPLDGSAAGTAGASHLGEQARTMSLMGHTRVRHAAEVLVWQTAGSAHILRLLLHRASNSVTGTLAHARHMDGRAD